MPGPRVLGRVVGRLSDQPGEGNERRCRQYELRGRPEVGHVVERDHDGREGERREERFAQHRGKPTRLPVPPFRRPPEAHCDDASRTA